MKRMVIKPTEFEMPLSEAPVGLFLHKDDLCLKSEYAKDGYAECFICESGEALLGGTSTLVLRHRLMVILCEAVWE